MSGGDAEMANEREGERREERQTGTQRHVNLFSTTARLEHTKIQGV